MATSMTPAADIAFSLCTRAEDFRRLVREWAWSPELWIDTETADWQTPHPRLSLLQVRTPEGRIHVVDILAPGTREVLDTAFIPDVMANPAIRKWAHSASFERRYLGGAAVQNLHCTVALARSIPYHRLPVRKLTLAALCGHLFGAALDKSHQKDDWGVRPLSDDQLAYAAADPEWCQRVQHALDGLVPSFDPRAEDPAALRDRYLDISLRFRERNARRNDIRDAVRDHLLAGSTDALGGFRLYRRATARTTIAELVRVATELDPGHTLAFDTAIPRAVSDLLTPRARDEVRAACEVRTYRTFCGPRVPGREPRSIYAVTADAERIDREYAEIDDARRRLDSERDEVRCRVKAWIEMSSLVEWEGFRFRDPSERWSMDMRALVSLVPAAASRVIAVPAQFRLAFGGGVLDRLEATMAENAFVVWRERLATHLDREASQSRDWHEAAAGVEEEG